MLQSFTFTWDDWSIAVQRVRGTVSITAISKHGETKQCYPRLNGNHNQDAKDVIESLVGFEVHYESYEQLGELLRQIS